MKSTGDAWMGTVEASEHLGITLRTLYRLIDTGQVPAYKFGRVIRLRRDEVEAFIAASRVSPGQLGHLYPQPEATIAVELVDADARG
jgi:excisionase family DNA binding protein